MDVAASDVMPKLIGVVRGADGKVKIDDLASITDEFIQVLSEDDVRDVLIRMRDKLREVQANGTDPFNRDP